MAVVICILFYLTEKQQENADEKKKNILNV
jgi:hypothetical protein